MKHLALTILFFWLTFFAIAQNNTQIIRGVILDKQSLSPIIGASIVLLPHGNKGAKSNSKGEYEISQISPGRYELKISYIGYKELILPNIVVSSGKETIVDIVIEENIKSLKGAKIKGSNKGRTINELASVSARTFSMEEVNRYAGGRSDPARLASNFAGVSTPDDSRNDN